MTSSRALFKAFALASGLAIAAAACGSSTATQAPASQGAASQPAASGGAASPSAAADACAGDPITLNIWGGYPEVDAVYKAAGEEFTKLHPNVSFTVFSTDLRGFEQKLTTAIPSGTAGDVVVRTTNFLSRFIDQNLLQPLPEDLNAAITSERLREGSPRGQHLRGQHVGHADLHRRHRHLLQHRHVHRGRDHRPAEVDGRPDRKRVQAGRQGRDQGTRRAPAGASGLPVRAAVSPRSSGSCSSSPARRSSARPPRAPASGSPSTTAPRASSCSRCTSTC